MPNYETISQRDPGNRLCVYSDASGSFWSGIITDLPFNDINFSHDEQHHKLLAFVSIRSKPIQLCPSTLSKEAYSFMTMLKQMRWAIINPDAFDIFTNHKIFISIFDPQVMYPNLSETSLRRVLRCAVRLSIYTFHHNHAKGSDNVWKFYLDAGGLWHRQTTRQNSRPTLHRI